MSELTVKEIWRYPVKSMQGERLGVARLTARGVPGDRIWAVRGPGGEKIADRKNALAGLLNCSARYDEAADTVEITLPDGDTVLLREGNEGEVAARLSPIVGREVSLHRTDRAAHAAEAGADRDAFTRALQRFCKPRAGDPAFPDTARYPSASVDEAMRYMWLFGRRDEIPPPHGFDLFPVNILTEASLRWLSRKLGKAADVRRFRPNLLVADTANADERIEFAWEGRRVAFGDGGAAIFCVIRCERCVMPSLPQGAELARDAAFNPAHPAAASYLSNYAVVAGEGPVAAGDRLTIGAA